MTQKDKQLLLITLCGMLPYDVKISIKDDYLQKMVDDILCAYHIGGISYNLESRNLRPYLRPMSSMTDEEAEQYSETCFYTHEIGDIPSLKSFDWLNAHHFDYRGLIPMGLALEAPKDMYKTE